MMRCVPIVSVALLLAGLSAEVSGELIPVPSFSNHDVPTTTVPHTDAPIWEWVHVIVLVIALTLATYFALVSRSRKHLLVLAVASLIWFGFVRDGCVCSVGSTQNVTQASFDSTYVVPLSVLAFFVLPLVFTLFFGRTFCAAVCPLGAAQEVVAVRSLRVPRWLDHALGLIPFIYLGAAVIFAATGTAYIICQYDPIVPFFRMSGNASMMAIGVGLLLLSVFVARPYCRYLCPYGAILGVLSRISKWHLRIVPGECISCRLCEDACPYGVILTPTVTQSAEDRVLGKRHFTWLLLAVPVIVLAMYWLGTTWGGPLSRLDFQVRLAEQLRLEELGEAEATDESDAFRNEGRSPTELYAEAIERREHFSGLGGWLGAWIGIVLAAKMIQLSVRRRRTEYVPDKAGCVSCGRCFKSCPVELVRLGLIEDVSEMIEETPA